MKNGNVIKLNLLHLNSCHFNGTEKVQKGSAGGGSIVIPPPTEPDIPPTYTLSASVTNGKVSAKRNGSAVNLPFTANEGDVIVLSVTPNDGYAFEGWADGNTDNPRSITMNADVVLSAQCVEVVQPPVDNYIQFEDEKVKTILMANGVSSDGIGITKEDCQKVVRLGGWLINSDIESFEEFEYFTECTEIGFTYGTSNNGFFGCSSLKKLKLPSSVKTIGVRTFLTTSSLKSLNLDNVTTIADSAFSESAIEEINAPSLATLGTNVFRNCIGLKKITSLGNIETIKAGGSGYGMFSGCTSLEEADLPSTLTTIGNNAFNGCTALVKVICRATTPPTLGTGQAFNNATIYVPDASVEAYKTATNWVDMAAYIHPLSEIEGSLVFYDKLVGDGTAYIKTDLMPNSFDNYEFDVSRAKNWNKFVFGSKSNKMSVGAVIYSGSQTFYLYTPNSTASTEVATGNGERMHRGLRTISLGDGKYRREEYRLHDGNENEVRTLISSTSIVDETSTMPLLVLACNVTASSNNPDRPYDGAIYSFIVTDSRTNEVRMSLKPCTWNGEAGMWDEVNGKFYGNASTSGEFSVAND